MTISGCGIRGRAFTAKTTTTMIAIGINAHRDHGSTQRLAAMQPRVTRILKEPSGGGRDRKSVVWGKSVDLGGRRIIKKKKQSIQSKQPRSDARLHGIVLEIADRVAL